MKVFLQFRAGLLLATAILTAPAASAAAALNDAFDKDKLIIVASSNACYGFDVYLAVTRAQRARGLMYVRELPETTGMLFVYEGAEYRSMWMKNTYIPLDMLFVRGDGTVSSVVTDTEPLSLRSIGSVEPVTYVLELNAGTAKRLEIDEHSYLIRITVDGD